MSDPTSLFDSHLHIVPAVALQVRRKLRDLSQFGWDADDLDSLLRVALWRTSHSYDAAKGASFKTWATLRMKYYVTDEARRAAHFRTTTAAARQAVVSLETRIPSRKGACITLLEALPGRSDAPSARAEGADEVRAILLGLTPDERAVVTAVHLEGRTKSEAARMIGLCPSRASQIHTQAMTFLRERLQGAAS